MELDMESNSGAVPPQEIPYYNEMATHGGGGGLKRTHNSAAEFTNRTRGGGSQRPYDSYKHRQDYAGGGGGGTYTSAGGGNQDDSGRYSRDHKPPNRGWKGRGGYGDSGAYMGGYKSVMSRGGGNADMQNYYGRGGHMSRGGGKRGASRIPSSQQPLARMTSGESESRPVDGDYMTGGSMTRYARPYDQQGPNDSSRMIPEGSRVRGDGPRADMSRVTPSQHMDMRQQKMANAYYSKPNKVPNPPPLSQGMFEPGSKGDGSLETPRDPMSKSGRAGIPPPPEQPLMKNPANGKFRQPESAQSSNYRDSKLCGKTGELSPTTPQSPKQHRAGYMVPRVTYEVETPAFLQGGTRGVAAAPAWQPPVTPSVATSAPPLTAGIRLPALKPMDTETEMPQFQARLAGQDPRSVICLVPRVTPLNVATFAETVVARMKREAALSRERELKMEVGRENIMPTTSQTQPPEPEPHKTQKYSIEFCLSLREDALRYYGKDITPMKMGMESTPLTTSHSAGRLGHHRRRSLGSGGNTATHHSPTYSNRSMLPEAPWPRSAANADIPTSPSNVPVPTRPAKAQLPREVVLRRTIKGLLNKLTVEQFQNIANSLSAEVQRTQNVQELAIVMEEVHSKSVREPNFSEMYADLVLVLRAKSPVFPSADSDKPNTFQRLLITKCQQEFDQMKDFANLELSEEDMKGMTEEDIENERIKRKTRTLGNMRFIGELNLRRIVANTALATILTKLVEGDPQYPPAHVVECVCELLTTIGYHMDNSEKEGDRGALNEVFSHLRLFHEKRVYESRINFKIQNLLELRESDWCSRFTFVDKANTLSNIRDSPSQNNVHIVGRQSDYPYKAFVRELNEDWLQRRKEQKKREADMKNSPSKADRSCCDAVGALYRELTAPGSLKEDQLGPELISQLIPTYSVKDIVQELLLLGCDNNVRQDLIVASLKYLAKDHLEDCSVTVAQTLLSILESISRRSATIKPIGDLLAHIVHDGSYREAIQAQMIWPSQKKPCEARQLLEKVQETMVKTLNELNPDLSPKEVGDLLEAHGIGF